MRTHSPNIYAAIRGLRRLSWMAQRWEPVYKRLLKELGSHETSRNADVKLVANESDLLSWHAFLNGPKDSPYEGAYQASCAKFVRAKLFS